MTAALGTADRALVRLSAALAEAGAAAEGSALETAMGAAAHRADPGEVEEVILQSHLFLGYPAALNAFAVWRRVSGRPAGAPSPGGPGGWEDRGEAVCRTVYAGQYEGLRANVRALHPDMERWMVADGYGKVLGRPGLELVRRELCVVALLTVLDAPTQLYAHLRGALNAGAREETVEEALEEAVRVAGAAAAGRARDAWARVRGRRGEARGTGAGGVG